MRRLELKTKGRAACPHHTTDFPSNHPLPNPQTRLSNSQNCPIWTFREICPSPRCTRSGGGPPWHASSAAGAKSDATETSPAAPASAPSTPSARTPHIPSRHRGRVQSMALKCPLIPWHWLSDVPSPFSPHSNPCPRRRGARELRPRLPGPRLIIVPEYGWPRAPRKTPCLHRRPVPASTRARRTLGRGSPSTALGLLSQLRLVFVRIRRRHLGVAPALRPPSTLSWKG